MIMDDDEMIEMVLMMRMIMMMMIMIIIDDDTVHCSTVRTDSIMIRNSRSYIWPAK